MQHPGEWTEQNCSCEIAWTFCEAGALRGTRSVARFFDARSYWAEILRSGVGKNPTLKQLLYLDEQ